MSARRADRPIAAVGFLLPYLVATAAFFAYPLLHAVRLAFYATNGPRSRVFVGWDNFGFVLGDPLFWVALRNTALFAFCSVALQLPLSLGLALLLHARSRRSNTVFRLILFAPNLVGQIFVGILFSVLFAPRYGLVNRALHAVLGWGLETRWLGDPRLVMPATILVSLWMYVGFNMVYFLAALQGVDRSLQEAATVDGASAWQVFWHVTRPALRPVTSFVVTMSLIGSFQLFELPQALLATSSGAGPGNAGVTLMTYLNDVAFRQGDLGLGAATGWIIATIIFVLSLVQLRISNAVNRGRLA